MQFHFEIEQVIWLPPADHFHAHNVLVGRLIAGVIHLFDEASLVTADGEVLKNAIWAIFVDRKQVQQIMVSPGEGPVIADLHWYYRRQFVVPTLPCELLPCSNASR